MCSYVIATHEVEAQKERAIKDNLGTTIDPSMSQDVKAVRRAEVEAIVGDSVKMAKEQNINIRSLITYGC